MIESLTRTLPGGVVLVAQARDDEPPRLTRLTGKSHVDTW